MKSNGKIRSFTLSEMLVVLLITAIVVGMAFAVLTLVRRQLAGIEENFSKNTTLSLFQQRLWQDFMEHNNAFYDSGELRFTSAADTVYYRFAREYTLRKGDTLPINLTPEKMYHLGVVVPSGKIDAIRLSAEKTLPGHVIFACRENDAAHFMNLNTLSDGF